MWRELGGPPIEAPFRSSYGSSLIRDLIPHELGGAVDLTFPSDGECCKIEIPLERGGEIPREDALRKAIMDYDALGASVRKFFKKLRVTADREIENAVRDAYAKRKLIVTTLPTSRSGGHCRRHRPHIRNRWRYRAGVKNLIATVVLELSAPLLLVQARSGCPP
jgi:hypothetical protein